MLLRFSATGKSAKAQQRTYNLDAIVTTGRIPDEIPTNLQEQLLLEDASIPKQHLKTFRKYHYENSLYRQYGRLSS
ncbi:hypothetical protein [Floridanema evergladense]|uniref:Uncharacterized protein n=1 Tax=Floridaenema evergladense BLCC-F167 TaxID=3153639 RepID=A0ABV4WFT9_9CYAN